MNKICYGCGVKLQTDDPKKLGYVPKEKILDSTYCQKCFQLIHYGKHYTSSEPLSTKSIIKIVNKSSKYVVFMIDFINIFDEIMDIFASITVPKVLVISKSDIIPSSISYDTIKSYLRRVYKVRTDIIFTSYKSKLNKFIKNLYDKDEVYFLGLTNVGKSTILNMLISEYPNKNALLTTSYERNTTKDFIKIHLGDKTYVDSPGFTLDTYEVGDSKIKAGEIKPKVYQNKVDSIYKIGSNLEIGVSGLTSIIFYFNKNLSIKRYYQKQMNGISFTIDANSDVVIAGLGFIKFTNSATITVGRDIVKYMSIRPSLVGNNR